MFRCNGKKNLLRICNKKLLWVNIGSRTLFSIQIQYTNGVLMLFRVWILFELFRWQIFILDTISDKPLLKRNRLSSRQIILFALFNLSLCIPPSFFFSLSLFIYFLFIFFLLLFIFPFLIYFSLSFFICFSISLCISIFLFYVSISHGVCFFWQNCGKKYRVLIVSFFATGNFVVFYNKSLRWFQRNFWHKILFIFSNCIHYIWSVWHMKPYTNE